MQKLMLSVILCILVISFHHVHVFSCNRTDPRTIHRDIATLPAYNKCISEELRVFCEGICNSEAHALQEKDKVVYAPDCAVCEATDIIVLGVPSKIICDGVNVVNHTAIVRFPRTCRCKRCSQMGPYNEELLKQTSN